MSHQPESNAGEPSIFPEPRRSGRIAGTVIGITVISIGALVAGVAFAASSQKVDDTKIVPGVRIATVEVGGLTLDEARAKVRNWVQSQVVLPVTFVAPKSGRRWNLPLAEVGGRYEYEPTVQAAFQIGKNENWVEHTLKGNRKRDIQLTPTFLFDTSLLDQRLAEIAKQVSVKPQNARAKLGEKGTIILATSEKKGIELDSNATKTALLKKGVESLRQGATVNLVLTEQRPEVTASDIGKIGSLLASFHTDFGSSSANRQHNIELAAHNINGTLLAPGQIFSYNDIVGPREHHLGWRDAPTYQDGQVVPGPGGGVCQTSTTLYNAVLRANLKVVRRSHHSMPVHYVPAGQDATVAYDSLDFRFQNTTKAPVFVGATTRGGVLRFNLYGASSAVPGAIRLVSGEHHPTRDGGFSVTTWRVVTDANGKTHREHLSTDTYRPYIKSDQPVGVKLTLQHRRKRRTRSTTGITTVAAPAPASNIAQPL